MEDIFNFKVNTDLYSGIGQTASFFKQIIEKNGYRRSLVLVDEGVKNKSLYFAEVLDEARKRIEIVDEMVLRGNEEPDYDYLDQIVCHIRSLGDIDLILGIGGGSCLDIAKASAALRNNQGTGVEYRGFDKLLAPGIPTLLIPTTAGTGSEVTINAVFTDKNHKKKFGINGR
ncbi:MAG: iron-containing alcohol dehydrogenase, partial [Syntrophales bacterium]|nr:iron-containing alcohol dehydrogenase [Syntrophales bacterium]